MQWLELLGKKEGYSNKIKKKEVEDSHLLLEIIRFYQYFILVRSNVCV